MKQSELETYRTRLEEKRRELFDRVRAARSGDEESGSDAPDIGDRASSTMSRELIYSLNASERETLRRIDAALDRIEDTSYGKCTNCGNEVQRGRLDAVPWALHCVDCQELQDRGEI